MKPDLLNKYNVAGPRYTSYPTVPCWDRTPTQHEWKLLVRDAFLQSNDQDGISLYIHLPFCESLCTYCGCNTRITVNHGVEKPYINTLLKEWAKYLEVFEETPRICEIHLGGGTPTFFSAENLTALIEGISSTAIMVKGAELSFEAHPNNITAEHLQKLFDAGFRRISLGVQDFDKKVQAAIHRFQSFEQVKEITMAARKIGYTSVNFDLIYGLPFQTLNTIYSTFNKIRALKPERISFYSYAHVPWMKPAQRGYSETDLPSPEQKSKLYETGRELLTTAGYMEIGMDHFALPGDSLSVASGSKTLHRNFMGYTTSKTDILIGLGASAISDTGTAFAQNVKSVEGYMEQVEKGGIPFFKGHILNAEDMILRGHIQNIICRGETSWRKKNEQCDALYSSLEQLEEAELDKLVTIYPFQLYVTKEGKPFLRNICMAFDARLRKKQFQTRLFSQTV